MGQGFFKGVWALRLMKSPLILPSSSRAVVIQALSKDLVLAFG